MYKKKNKIKFITCVHRFYKINGWLNMKFWRFMIIIFFIAAILFSCSSWNQSGNESRALLEPEAGTYFGVNLHWANDSPADFNERLGYRAAVYVRFYPFPPTQDEYEQMDKMIEAVRGENGMAMITLEPINGLDNVTQKNAEELANQLATYNSLGVSVFIRFGHEMNGSWYPWSQQPSAYIRAFRLLADAIHSQAHLTAMVWAPNYGGGYPFSDGRYEAKTDSVDFSILDTNQDGQIAQGDDPYEPYYPGDDAVDWVGMSLYHWGNIHPWGENEIPEADKFYAQLTGSYNGLNGDERALPDFYQIYYEMHGKPIAITETAAFYNPALPGPDELFIKQFWWRQIYHPVLLQSFPGIKMINWFEHKKPEIEVGNVVIDWRVLDSGEISDAYLADLPVEFFIFAHEEN